MTTAIRFSANLFYRQWTAADPGLVHNRNRMEKFVFGRAFKNSFQKPQHFLLIVVSAPEQNNTRIFGAAYGEKLRIIKVSGNDDAVLFSRDLNDPLVLCVMKTDSRRMISLVAALPEP